MGAEDLPVISNAGRGLRRALTAMLEVEHGSRREQVVMEELLFPW
jgi:hypothetical protein